MQREERCGWLNSALFLTGDVVYPIFKGIEVDSADRDACRSDGHQASEEALPRGYEIDDDDGIDVHESCIPLPGKGGDFVTIQHIGPGEQTFPALVKAGWLRPSNKCREATLAGRRRGGWFNLRIPRHASQRCLRRYLLDGASTPP